jgi:hypothetical protein
VSEDRDGDLVMVAYDTSTWTRAGTEEFVRSWQEQIARERRGDPGPLCIDGRAYRRKQRARRRRGR